MLAIFPGNYKSVPAHVRRIPSKRFKEVIDIALKQQNVSSLILESPEISGYHFSRVRA
jgi:hypothetical protein